MFAQRSARTPHLRGKKRAHVPAFDRLEAQLATMAMTAQAIADPEWHSVP